jgi:hypothetical protein
MTGLYLAGLGLQIVKPVPWAWRPSSAIPPLTRSSADSLSIDSQPLAPFLAAGCPAVTAI